MLRRFAITLLTLPILLSTHVLAVIYEDLPEEPQGKFLIHHPDYQGVAALLPLSNKWLIVVTENIAEIAAEIDRLSDGAYMPLSKKWETSEFTSQPDWASRNRASELRDKYMVQARLNAGERELDKPETFTITSTDDPHYQEAQKAVRTTRWIASLDARRVSGGFHIHFAHYSYLEMPHPLQNGSHYTITVGENKKVNFLYDENYTVSRAIKTNQIGYLPSAKGKYAYISGYLQDLGPLEIPDETTFKVIDADTGETVLTGPVTLRAANPEFLRKGLRVRPAATPSYMYGENVYEMNISALEKEGNYFISVPGVGRSWPFRHAEDIYGEVFYIAARGLYHQRCGIALEKEYTPWTRISCHHDPVYESDHVDFLPPTKGPAHYDRFDVIAATFDRSRETRNPEGGWHDAADWDRTGNQYTCILDLLGLYEMYPNKFQDGQLNIPESGNGIPDILDEAEYGLKAWRKSMTPEGGVSGAIETWTHPSIDDPNVDYAYSRRTRWNTLIYAGAAATYAHLVRPFSPEKAELYTKSALKAYEWGLDNKNSIKKTVFKAKNNRGKGEDYTIEWENDPANLKPYLVYAALRLFILTDDESYLEKLALDAKGSPAPYKYPFRYQNFSPWLYYGFIHPAVREKADKTLPPFWDREFHTAAADLWRFTRDQAYRHSWPGFQDYWLSWGNSCLTNRSRCLLIGAHITNNENYREAAIFDADFMFGVNPLGMVWTTGLGYQYPVTIQHAVSEMDGIPDPVPGITLFGVTEGIFWDLKNSVWETPTGDGQTEVFMAKEKWTPPLWRRFFAHPHRNTPQNEFTVHETISSTVFTAGALMPEGWMPSEKLKNKQPRREDRLFGLYYLP